MPAARLARIAAAREAVGLPLRRDPSGTYTTTVPKPLAPEPKLVADALKALAPVVKEAAKRKRAADINGTAAKRARSGDGLVTSVLSKLTWKEKHDAYVNAIDTPNFYFMSMAKVHGMTAAQAMDAFNTIKGEGMQR